MKRIFFGLMTCLAVAAALPAYSADNSRDSMQDPQARHENWKGQDLIPPAMHDSSPCQDSMETIPDDDDLVPMPAAADASCKAADRPIGT